MKSSQIYDLFDSVNPQLESLRGQTSGVIFILDDINYSQNEGISGYMQNIAKSASSGEITIPNYIIKCSSTTSVNFLCAPTEFIHREGEIISFSELRHNKKITSELNSLGESILLNSHGKTHLLKKLFKVEIVCHHLGAKPRFVSYVLETIGENIHTFNEW
jgi:hypothetical protein